MFSGSLAERTLALASIPSVTGKEESLCQQLGQWLAQTLPAARILRWRQGLAILPRPEMSQPLLALVGHLDTVPPASSQRLGIYDGAVWGCGTSDMKAGLALILAALEEGRGNLLGIFYDREEGPLAENGLVPLLDLVPHPELAIVLEPTDNKVQAGCVGSLHARLTFRGRRAHSARPWEGDNALYQALPALERLRQQPPIEVKRGGLCFQEVMTPTLAWTDGTRNVVPETFHLNVNCRFGPGRTDRDILNDLQRLTPEADLELLDSAPSGEVCLDHPWLSRWIAATSRTVEAKQAWTDVAQLTARKIAAVNFGPGHPALAHQAEEHVRIDSLEQGFAQLRCLINATE